MASDVTMADQGNRKASRRPLFLGLGLAVLLGAGGFYATWSGLVLGQGGAGSAGTDLPGPLTGIAFVPLETMVVSLSPGAGSRHLRFSAQVEVAAEAAQDVELLKPRIADVMNSYLRAIETAEIEDPRAMARIRAQMLRRIQIVTGTGRVRDLLITEFVLN